MKYFDDLIQQQVLSAQSAEKIYRVKKNRKFTQQYTLNDVLKIANLFTPASIHFIWKAWHKVKLPIKGKIF